MRLKIIHTTRYNYTWPVRHVIELLRLTPQDEGSQIIRHWHIDVEGNVSLHASKDAYGNRIHTFTLDGPISELTIRAEGEIETIETHGIVSDREESMPPALFLRPTALTAWGDGLRELNQTLLGLTKKPLDLSALHSLLTGLHGLVTFDTDPTHAGTTANEAAHLRRGVCQDLAHMFMAICRHHKTPARYVSGYLYRHDGQTDVEATHAWTEAWLPDLGWVGFDPANGVCAHQGYVALARGPDYLAAAPIRGSHFGGGGESLHVAVHVSSLS